MRGHCFLFETIESKVGYAELRLPSLFDYGKYDLLLYVLNRLTADMNVLRRV